MIYEGELMMTEMSFLVELLISALYYKVASVIRHDHYSFNWHWYDTAKTHIRMCAAVIWVSD